MWDHVSSRWDHVGSWWDHVSSWWDHVSSWWDHVSTWWAHVRHCNDLVRVISRHLSTECSKICHERCATLATQDCLSELSN